MVDVPKIRGRMAELGISQDDLAKSANMTSRTLRTKLKSGKFTIPEAAVICSVLKFEEPGKIFFN